MIFLSGEEKEQSETTGRDAKRKSGVSTDPQRGPTAAFPGLQHHSTFQRGQFQHQLQTDLVLFIYFKEVFHLWCLVQRECCCDR